MRITIFLLSTLSTTLTVSIDQSGKILKKVNTILADNQYNFGIQSTLQDNVNSESNVQHVEYSTGQEEYKDNSSILPTNETHSSDYPKLLQKEYTERKTKKEVLSVENSNDEDIKNKTNAVENAFYEFEFTDKYTKPETEDFLPVIQNILPTIMKEFKEDAVEGSADNIFEFGDDSDSYN